MAKKAAKTAAPTKTIGAAMSKATSGAATKETNKSSKRAPAKASAKEDAAAPRAQPSTTAKPAQRASSRRTKKQQKPPDVSDEDFEPASRASENDAQPPVKPRFRPSLLPLRDQTYALRDLTDKPRDTWPSPRSFSGRGPFFPRRTPSSSSIGDWNSEYDPATDPDFSWAAIPRRSKVYVQRPYREDELAELNDDVELKEAVARAMAEAELRERENETMWKAADDEGRKRYQDTTERWASNDAGCEHGGADHTGRRPAVLNGPVQGARRISRVRRHMRNFRRWIEAEDVRGEHAAFGMRRWRHLQFLGALTLLTVLAAVLYGYLKQKSADIYGAV